jgi:Ser/Thr protein kinase RdoA (MazF antagonist)
MHRASSIRQAQHRLICTPPGSTARFIAELEESGGVHPNLAGDFFAIARRMLSRIQPLFEDLPLQRIHGDCHRGNILNRGAEGLLLIDFDDMMVGPAIQDLWMLLPSRLEDCGWEMELILEGYQQWSHLDRRQLELIEPLRFMRMIYYLAWQNRQRQDRGFQENNPAWGSHAFWIKELEDLREQERWL